MALVLPFPTPDEEGGYRRHLKRLGIPAEAVTEAIGNSNSERRLAAIGSAKGAQGYYAYNGVVVGLTDHLPSDEWRRTDLGGVLPLWVNDSRKIKLGVSSGNAITGVRLPGEQPRTRYPKGELVRQMVERNPRPGWEPLFDLAMEVEVPGELSEYALWLLLFYFDKAKSEIRTEISHPVDVNARGIITGWSPRIIQPPYPAADLPGDGEDPNDGFGDIDVPVQPL